VFVAGVDAAAAKLGAEAEAEEGTEVEAEGEGDVSSANTAARLTLDTFASLADTDADPAAGTEKPTTLDVGSAHFVRGAPAPPAAEAAEDEEAVAAEAGGGRRREAHDFMTGATGAGAGAGTEGEGAASAEVVVVVSTFCACWAAGADATEESSVNAAAAADGAAFTGVADNESDVADETGELGIVVAAVVGVRVSGVCVSAVVSAVLAPDDGASARSSVASSSASASGASTAIGISSFPSVAVDPPAPASLEPMSRADSASAVEGNSIAGGGGGDAGGVGPPLAFARISGGGRA
jgi:hypothetical protein